MLYWITIAGILDFSSDVKVYPIKKHLCAKSHTCLFPHCVYRLADARISRMHFGSHSNDQLDSAAHAGIQPLGKIRVTSTVLFSGCHTVDVAGAYLVLPVPFQWHLFGKQLELSHCCQTVQGLSHTHKP